LFGSIAEGDLIMNPGDWVVCIDASGCEELTDGYDYVIDRVFMGIDREDESIGVGVSLVGIVAIGANGFRIERFSKRHVSTRDERQMISLPNGPDQGRA
jgi:hypothetical protein